MLSSLDEASDHEARVADYLLRETDFLLRRPDVLMALEVPHRAAGSAISLIERQVRVLRQQLETEHNRLLHLIARARDFEALSEHLHRLVLRLIAARDAQQVCGVLQETLLNELSADAMALKLFATEDDQGFRDDPLTLAFRDFVDRHQALCGPLDETKAGMLFGGAGGSIRSTALVPLHADGHAGVLAIGSRDPARFTPDMRTDLLDRLGEIVSQKLHVIQLDLHVDLPEVLKELA